MLEKIRNILMLMVLLALVLSPLPWPRNAYAAEPVSITDVNLLEVLDRQHINPLNVRLAQTANAEHPYSEVYISVKDNKAFQVFSQLPKANSEGQLIRPMWISSDDGYSALANTFQARVSETVVYLTCINDQDDGRLAGQTLEWNPQVVVGDTEYTPASATPTRLQADPVNSAYSWNTLEWDYEVCKRQLRLIEGSILESWVFTNNPGDTVRIIHNQTGFYGLKLGSGADEVTTQDAIAIELPQITTVRKQFATQQIELGGKIGGGKIEPLPIEPQPQPIEQDVEVFYAESFDTATYPLRIGGSITFNPTTNPGVDGLVYGEYNSGTDWATIHSLATQIDTYSTGTIAKVGLLSYTDVDTWKELYRAPIYLATSSLPDACNITSATFTLYGVSKTDGLGMSPGINIYSTSSTSTTTLIDSDYNWAGYTNYSSTINYSFWQTSGGSNTFTLNAAGIGNISKTGITRFVMREAWHDALDSEPTWSSNKVSGLYFYTSENGSSTAPKLVVTYTGEPTVVTNAVGSIISTSATLNGNITGIGAGNATVRGFAYDTSSHPLPGNVAPAASGYSYNVSESGDFSTGNYSLAASPLGKYVTYYVRAFALNIVGYAYGGEVSFTTLHDVPTVATNAATSVTSYSAVLNGSITDLGGYGACTQYKYEWGLGSGNYSVGSWTSDVGAYGLGAYDSDSHATGLIGNTTYHFIFSALNAYGWGSGNDTSFATLDSAIAVITMAASSSTDTTAILNGNITNTGAGVILRGVNWGTTSPPTHLASESGTWYTNGVYSLTVTGLTPDTVYYCQAHIQDIDGNTTDGVVLSFLTLPSTWSGSPFSGTTAVWSPVGTLPTQPTGWNLSTTPAFTNSQLPWVDFFTSIFSYSGYPVSFMWWLVLAITITFLGILVYEVSNAVIVIFILGILCLAVICSMGWLDWWVIAPYVMWGLSSLVVERQFGF